MKTCTFLALCWVVATTAYANFNIDFQRQYRAAEAERAFNAKKFEEARNAFLELANDSADGAEAAKWKARAAIALGSQEGKYEPAMAEAIAIDNAPYSIYAQTSLMASRKEYAQLIEKFGADPVMDWQAEYPIASGRRLADEDVRSYVLVDRGTAFAALGEGQKANDDLTQAVTLINEVSFKTGTLAELAKIREQLLDDPDGAFDANMEIVAVGSGGATYYRGVLGAVAWLRANQDYDAALEILQSMEERQQQPFEQWRGLTWPTSLLQAYALTYEAMGQTNKAIESYQRIFLVDGVTDKIKAQTEESIANLSQAKE